MKAFPRLSVTLSMKIGVPSCGDQTDQEGAATTCRRRQVGCQVGRGQHPTSLPCEYQQIG